MNDAVECGEGRGIVKYPVGEELPIEPVADVSGLPETLTDGAAHRRIAFHKPFGLDVRIVNGDAPLRKKAANRRLAAADSAGHPHLHHGSTGFSISGIAPNEITLISLNRTDRALCSDWGSIAIIPSCPSSCTGLYLSSERGIRTRLFI